MIPTSIKTKIFVALSLFISWLIWIFLDLLNYGKIWTSTVSLFRFWQKTRQLRNLEQTSRPVRVLETKKKQHTRKRRKREVCHHRPLQFRASTQWHKVHSFFLFFPLCIWCLCTLVTPPNWNKKLGHVYLYLVKSPPGLLKEIEAYTLLPAGSILIFFPLV